MHITNNYICTGGALKRQISAKKKEVKQYWKHCLTPIIKGYFDL